MGSYMCEDADVINMSYGPLLSHKVVFIVAILCYTESSINTCVSGVTLFAWRTRNTCLSNPTN